MSEYRVTVETLTDAYQYYIEAPNEGTAEDEAENMALADGMDPHRYHYFTVEVL